MKVTIYSKPMCGQCNMTKMVFNEEIAKLKDKSVIDLEIVDVMEDEAALNHCKFDLGLTSMPVVEAEGFEPYFGFRPDNIKEIVQSA